MMKRLALLSLLFSSAALARSPEPPMIFEIVKPMRPAASTFYVPPTPMIFEIVKPMRPAASTFYVPPTPRDLLVPTSVYYYVTLPPGVISCTVDLTSIGGFACGNGYWFPKE